MIKQYIYKTAQIVLPSCVFKKIETANRARKWRLQQVAYKKEIERLTGYNKPLNVVFMVLYSSVWKYDSVYKLMEKDPRFHPLILVCPIADYGHQHMLENLKPTYEMFKKKGYNVMCAYNEENGKYVNVEDLNPDILMYAFQWSSHVDARYNVYSLRKYLKCYVNYSFKSTPFEWSIASQEQGLMWIYFSECEDNRQYALSFNDKEFQNMCIVGYPIYDEVNECKETGHEWPTDRGLKRIIWAPHHTIAGNDSALKLSTFLLYADNMLEYANKYKDRVQFVFKPHPQLKAALYKHPEWGAERTEAYYKKWAEMGNTAIVSGPYIDLFKSSDAMIHDCGSFLVEYLYVNKPVMFMSNYDREGQCNVVGKKAYNVHYHGTSKEDIESFIEDVVINGNDTMRDKRQLFYDSILVPPHGKSVAENIIDEITKTLNI